jgi:hypothetical protein
MACEHLKQRPRYPSLGLQRLVRIGRRPQRNLRSRLQPLQLLGQQPGGIFLEINFSFKILLRTQFEELMRVSGIAVAASKFTAAIWVDGVGKGQPTV